MTDATTPRIDYTATSYQALRDQMDKYAQEKFGVDKAVAWTDFNANNPGSVLFDVTAMAGELLVYMLNAYSREQFISTLLREQSFLNLSKSYDFQPRLATQATVALTLVSDPNRLPYTLSAANFRVSNGNNADPVIFQPIADMKMTDPTQTVQFIEGIQITGEMAGASNGAQFQRFPLAQPNAIASTLVVLVGGTLWTQALNYSDLGPNDPAFLIDKQEGGISVIKFGDGVNGAVPPQGVSVYVNYKSGGGQRGNVGPNTLTSIVTPIDAVLSCANFASASGGSDAMTVIEGQKALPASLATQKRAIAVGDYTLQALTVPGVAKAAEIAGDPATKQILLPIAPVGGGYPTTALKNRVTQHFAAVKPLTFNVVPIAPYYLNLSLSMTLYVKANYRQGQVLADTTAAVLDLLSFERVGFQTVIRLQDIYDAINNNQPGLEGIGYIQIERLTAATTPRVAYGATVTGNGSFSNIRVSDNSSEKTYLVQVTQTSPQTLFTVIERLTGKVGAISDTVLTDPAQSFQTNELVGQTLNPNTAQFSTYPIVANTPTTLSVATGASLQSVAVPNNTYALDRVSAATGKILRGTVNIATPSQQNIVFTATTDGFAVGDQVAISDGVNIDFGVIAQIAPYASMTLVSPLTNSYAPGATIDAVWASDSGAVSFCLSQGTTPFVIGDKFFLDTYSPLHDVEPRDLDIPLLTAANLNIRPVGGLN